MSNTDFGIVLSQWKSFEWLLDGLIYLALLLLFEGARRLVAHRMSRKLSVSFVVLGALLVTSTVVLQQSRLSSLQAWSSALSPRMPDASVQVWDAGNSLPLWERTKKSRLLAQRFYDLNGELARHISPTGEPTVFAPTQEEIRGRENRVRDLALLNHAIDTSNQQMKTDVLAALLALVCGLLAGRLSANRLL